jgi:hypothetical protein
LAAEVNGDPLRLRVRPSQRAHNCQIVPPSKGRELFALANELREYQSIAGRGHNDIADDFVPVNLEWLGRVFGRL